ncbi:hypothetical protein [Streptomyces sp. B1I3]|uniref:hypothetical protein n=1 Tax=Streptomyces sp. B1I3 TaxID=3042264 RepID=UPI002788049D|nr:hypothetical protein [Streptomyces sp. B1I3]MDQ0791742.1 hypothetical protein [Streptomyces sp. B1I3]
MSRATLSSDYAEDAPGSVPATTSHDRPIAVRGWIFIARPQTSEPAVAGGSVGRQAAARAGLAEVEPDSGNGKHTSAGYTLTYSGVYG